MGQFLELLGATLKDWVSLVLLAIGIKFSGDVFLGGLFLALAGAAISRAWEREIASRKGEPFPRESQFRFWLVVLTAFFVSLLVAIMVNAHFPDWSVQVCMAVSGFASRRLVYTAIGFLEGISNRGDTLAQKTIDKFLK